MSAEIVDAIGWTIPGLQAFFDSPNWWPVLLRDAVVYIWPSNDYAEALLVPDKPKAKLFYVTRRSERVLLFLVDPQVPGGRISNVYKEPLIFDRYWLFEFIALFVAFKGDLKRIVTECSSHGNGTCVKCGNVDICYDDRSLTVTITPVTQQDDP